MVLSISEGITYLSLNSMLLTNSTIMCPKKYSLNQNKIKEWAYGDVRDVFEVVTMALSENVLRSVLSKAIPPY